MTGETTTGNAANAGWLSNTGHAGKTGLWTACDGKRTTTCQAWKTQTGAMLFCTTPRPEKSYQEVKVSDPAGGRGTHMPRDTILSRDKAADVTGNWKSSFKNTLYTNQKEP